MAAGIFVTPTRDVCFTTNASDSKKVALISHTFLLESYYSYLSYLFIMYRKSTWETQTFEMLLANLLDMIVPPTKAKFAMDLDNMTTDALLQARWFFMAVLNMIESSESLGQHGTARFFVTYGRMQVRRRQGTRFAPCLLAGWCCYKWHHNCRIRATHGRSCDAGDVVMAWVCQSN